MSNLNKQTIKGKKIRLTKNRLKALHTAISIDDILYEKYRRLNDDLNQKIERLWRPMNKIVQVRQRKGNVNYILQVKDIKQTGEGFIVYV